MARRVVEHLEQHPELDAVGMRLDLARRRRELVVRPAVFLRLAFGGGVRQLDARAARMPMPGCPGLRGSRGNWARYGSSGKTGGICWRMMRGRLSVTVTRRRLAWLGGGGGPPLATASSFTTTSGRIPASSQASRALSTASLTQVRSALRGLSKPRTSRFLVKNSYTEISRCRAPISTADTHGFGLGGAVG